MGSIVSTTSSPNRQNEIMGDPLHEAITADRPQGQGATPSEQKAITGSNVSEEIDESAVLPQFELTTESVTFTDEEMGTLHRFFGLLMPAPEKVFGSTTSDLARHLHDMIDAHEEGLVKQISFLVA